MVALGDVAFLEGRLADLDLQAGVGGQDRRVDLAVVGLEELRVELEQLVGLEVDRVGQLGLARPRGRPRRATATLRPTS